MLEEPPLKVERDGLWGNLSEKDARVVDYASRAPFALTWRFPCRGVSVSLTRLGRD